MSKQPGPCTALCSNGTSFRGRRAPRKPASYNRLQDFRMLSLAPTQPTAGASAVAAGATGAATDTAARTPCLAQVGGMIYYPGQIVKCLRCSLRFRSPQPCHSLVCPACILPIEEENVAACIGANAQLIYCAAGGLNALVPPEQLGQTAARVQPPQARSLNRNQPSIANLAVEADQLEGGDNQEEERQWQRLQDFLHLDKLANRRGSNRTHKPVQLYDPSIEASRPQVLARADASTSTPPVASLKLTEGSTAIATSSTRWVQKNRDFTSTETWGADTTSHPSTEVTPQVRLEDAPQGRFCRRVDQVHHTVEGHETLWERNSHDKAIKRELQEPVLVSDSPGNAVPQTKRQRFSHAESAYLERQYYLLGPHKRYTATAEMCARELGVENTRTMCALCLLPARTKRR